MAITQTPKILMRLEAGGRCRLMFENPNDGYTANPVSGAEVINRLRIFHTIHSSVAVTDVEDVVLPFVLDDQPTELYFEPPLIGLYVFAWAHVNAAAQPTPKDIEGPRAAGVYVYGRTTIFDLLQTAGQIDFGDAFTQAVKIRFIEDSSRMFDAYAGWHFFPLYQAFPTDGKDSFDLTLPLPIIEVLELSRLDHFREGRPSIITPSEYRVFNRHMAFRHAYDPAVDSTRPDGYLEAPGDGSGGQTVEDDRFCPMISLGFANEYGRGHMHAGSGMAWSLQHRGVASFSKASHLGGFSRGRQHIIVKGFFGFTEPDLSVPIGIQVATERLAIRNATLEYGTPDDVERILRGHRVIMEKTDTHSIMYEPRNKLSGFFTGDETIDQWIANYSRTMGGSVV
jgi:hypothetical protein